LAEHVIKTEHKDIIKRIMLVKAEGKRKEGRPRIRWMVWRRI
jgi:hypothetical protein